MLMEGLCRLEYAETKQMELYTSNRDTVNMFLYDLRVGRTMVGHGSTCTDPWPIDPLPALVPTAVTHDTAGDIYSVERRVRQDNIRTIILSSSTSTRQRDNKAVKLNYYYWQPNDATPTNLRHHAVPDAVQRHPRRWNDCTYARNLTSIDGRDGTLRQHYCFDSTGKYARQRIRHHLPALGKGWEVNVHLLRTFTDVPTLRLRTVIALRPDKRLWTVILSMNGNKRYSSRRQEDDAWRTIYKFCLFVFVIFRWGTLSELRQNFNW